MLCFILIYSHRILVFMNIFGCFFQKGHFKGSAKKRAHQQKTLGRGSNDPPAPLFRRAWLKIPKMSCNGNRHISSLWRHLKKCDGPIGCMKFNSGRLFGIEVLLTIPTNYFDIHMQRRPQCQVHKINTKIPMINFCCNMRKKQKTFKFSGFCLLSKFYQWWKFEAI